MPMEERRKRLGRRILSRSGSRGSMRMKKPDCIITGSGIIRRWMGVIRSRIRLGLLMGILHFMVMYMIQICGLIYLD